jgi:hypothetical protein
MTNPIVEKVEGWLWQIAVKKGIASLVKVAIAFVTSVKLDPILKQLGVTVDPVTLTGGVTAFITAGLTMLQNWLKVKFNLSWL